MDLIQVEKSKNAGCAISSFYKQANLRVVGSNPTTISLQMWCSSVGRAAGKSDIAITSSVFALLIRL